MKNPPRKKTIIQDGEEILYDGLRGWIFKPQDSKDAAWLLLEEGTPESVSWQRVWSEHRVRPIPHTRYAETLGIGSPEKLPSNPQHPLDRITCPFCGSKYSSRFEMRPEKSYCTSCLGQGERAMYADALVEAWITEIRKTRNIALAEHLEEALAEGYQQFEIRRTIRALKTDRPTQPIKL